MNQQTTNKPSEKPNFDFIVNQPAPEQDHKPKKKVIIIVVLAGLLFVVMVVGFIFSANRNVQPQTTISTSAADSQQVVTQFLEAVSAQDYEKAYTLMVPGTTEFTNREFFVSQGGPSLQALDLQSCQVSIQSVKLNNAQLDAPVARCKIKNSNVSLFLVFDMKVQASPLIIGFNPRESI